MSQPQSVIDKILCTCTYLRMPYPKEKGQFAIDQHKEKDWCSEISV